MAKSGAEPRNPTPKRGSKREQKGPQASLNPKVFRLHFRQYVKHHFRSAYLSVMRQIKAPISTLLTCSVIGIALTFPAILYIALQNIQLAGKQWPQTVRISVFVKKELSLSKTRDIAQQILGNPLTKSVKVLSPAMALAEYSKLLGSEQTIKIQYNPLPPIIIIQLHNLEPRNSALNHFVTSLKKYGQIQSVHLDKTMIDRLYKIVDIGNRSVFIIAVLLALGVILITGNTIRLDIQNRKDEIIVSKLIGASNRYIRLPFLYSGFWYGLFGGLIALGLTLASVNYLTQPVAEFAQISGETFLLQALNLAEIVVLFSASTLLGLLGSGVSVSQHLHAIEPT
ncbi:Cell-division-associated, ABC-transporter-like signaling protein FtsX [hydrothermal vent metagenome]|uniref:Cell division protein FtsX n=1 Tax=hydrothermal vent metagenome TaxID=652676 RepID=A0A3B0Z9C8_9ZZZZ